MKKLLIFAFMMLFLYIFVFTDTFDEFMWDDQLEVDQMETALDNGQLNTTSIYLFSYIIYRSGSKKVLLAVNRISVVYHKGEFIRHSCMEMIQQLRQCIGQNIELFRLEYGCYHDGDPELNPLDYAKYLNYRNNTERRDWIFYFTHQEAKQCQSKWFAELDVELEGDVSMWNIICVDRIMNWKNEL